MDNNEVTRLKSELAAANREIADLKDSLSELESTLTRLKEAEQALRLSEEKFQQLFEHAAEEVIHLDKFGTVIDVNESVEKLFGYRREDIVGHYIFDFDVFTPGTKQQILALYDAALEEKYNYFLEVELQHKDGRPVNVEPTGSLIKRDGQVEGILVFLKDVTERKQWEQKLEDLYKQEVELRQQIEAEMQRRVEFARTLAHELKTPLTSIIASSDSLLGELQENRSLSLAQNIARSATNLSSRIDELLDLARGEVGILEVTTEPIDPLQLLHESVDSIIPLAINHGQTLNLKAPNSLPFIRADASRIQQVILNLLDNAVKFTPKGGTVKVKAARTNQWLTIEVQDTGPGIPKKDQERVFEPYHRLASDKGRLEGLGLGLALCKRLVELHGGQIWVKSRPGKGASFGFTLPLEPGLQPESGTEKTVKLRRVLLIEDDQEIIDSISLAFEKDWPEAELIATRMGEEGVELVETGDIDIIILDLGLPDIDGFDVLKQIRLFSSVPIVIVTVRGEESDITKGLLLGADDYVTKPFRKKELLARMQVQLRKQTIPDEESPIICGTLRLEPSTFQLTHGTIEKSLTTVEGHILQCLMRNWGRVVTHSRLAAEVWGEDYPGAVVSLRTHIRSLRGKLEADPGHPELILTKAGVGYSLARNL